MAPKHTPGPWMAAARPSSVVGWPIVAQSNGKSIASVTHIGKILDRDFTEEAGANARLIAAAPDMYEALRDLQSLVASMDATAEEIEAALEVARAAIAKAEGR